MQHLSSTQWNDFNAKNTEQIQRCADDFYAVFVGEIRTRHRLDVSASVLLRVFVVRQHLLHSTPYRLEVGEHGLHLEVGPRDAMNGGAFVRGNELLSGHSKHWNDVRQQQTSFKPIPNVVQQYAEIETEITNIWWWLSEAVKH